MKTFEAGDVILKEGETTKEAPQAARSWPHGSLDVSVQLLRSDVIACTLMFGLKGDIMIDLLNIWVATRYFKQWFDLPANQECYAGRCWSYTVEKCNLGLMSQPSFDPQLLIQVLSAHGLDSNDLPNFRSRDQKMDNIGRQRNLWECWNYIKFKGHESWTPKKRYQPFRCVGPLIWETPMLKLYSYVQVMAAEQIVTL